MIIYDVELHGEKYVVLPKDSVEFILSEIEKAKAKIYKLDADISTIIVHLNNIGAKLTNH